jgi:hypothetical protein
MAETASFAWSLVLEQTAIVLGASVGGWVLVFLGTVCGQTNEIAIGRRHLFLSSLAALVLGVGAIGCLALEALVMRRIVWPHLGVLLPLLELVSCMLSMCLGSHACFRWVQFVLQSAAIVMNVLSIALEDVQVQCLEAGTCVTSAGSAAGWSLSQLYLLRWFRLTCCIASVWLVLGSGFLLITLGACWPRYSPRLFSADHPLSQLPERSGREHRRADAQGVSTALARIEASKRRKHLRAGSPSMV